MTHFRNLIVLSAAVALGVCIGLGIQSTESVTREVVAAAEKLIGLSFTEVKRDSMLEGLRDLQRNYQGIRSVPLSNAVPPALGFQSLPLGFRHDVRPSIFRMSPLGKTRPAEDPEAIAFSSVAELSAMIRDKRITSTELTRLYLERLKKYGPRLQCVVTLTEDLAMRQAKRADEEIVAGKYRGPLHGIPYGLKDLFSTRGIKTTWGSVPFKEQTIDENATVVDRLEHAGAVLVAKTTVGELAWGDVWFGGQTRNPWNLEQGSSGSSAGSAAATSAGLVAFSIGTETWGSIVSPSTRCGVTGLRPTFGRVSRTGAMALSWTMDKVGPICRTVEDCALVLNAIYGPDGKDASVVGEPFRYTPDIDLGRLTVGFVKQDFDSAHANRKNDSTSLATLRAMGVRLVPVSLPAYPIEDLAIILNAEAGAAFDDLTRSGKDELMVRQIKDAWPNVLRLSRFIPAVEYLQANRIRTLVIDKMENLMRGIDLFVAPSLEGNSSLLTNLTGHPCVVVPNGMNENGSPTSITFVGRLFQEGELLAFSRKYQERTGFHLRHPPGFE